MLAKINPSSTKSWKKLKNHQQALRELDIKTMFANNPLRFEQFSLKAGPWFFDFSKNLINRQTLTLLEELFDECRFEEARQAMFSGEPINETEQRPVLHTALRYRGNEQITVNGQNVIPEVKEVLSRIHDFSDLLISGNWKGFSGKTIKDVVNIGIGGSDLGPQMVYEALKPYHNHLRCHFVSNVDAAHLAETLKGLDPAQTLFIIASKSFTTQETMANAQSARKWFLRSEAREDDIARHFVAVSTNQGAVEKFGIDATNMFGFWDWVGGRYSLWSAIGLPLACGLGFKNFEKLLKGAYEADQDFEQREFTENPALLMAAISLWYLNFWSAHSEVVVPYSQNLHRLAAYLQQANMESNGKSTDRSGQAVNYNTGPVVWGEPGTNGQHAFFQLLHQGSHFIPADFIAFASSDYDFEGHQEKLLANCLAQSQALMEGRSEEDVRTEMRAEGQSEEDIEKIGPYRSFQGNRPSNTFIAEKLDPESLGYLLACYEHKIFAQGVIWNIFSFDQWGVELGKKLAKPILTQLEEPKEESHFDASTNGLIGYLRELRK